MFLISVLSFSTLCSDSTAEGRENIGSLTKVNFLGVTIVFLLILNLVSSLVNKLLSLGKEYSSFYRCE